MLIKLLYDQDIFLGKFLNLRYNKLSMIVDNYYIYNTCNFRWSCFPPNDPTLFTTGSSHNIRMCITLYPVTNYFLFDDFLCRYISENHLNIRARNSERSNVKGNGKQWKPERGIDKEVVKRVTRVWRRNLRYILQ